MKKIIAVLGLVGVYYPLSVHAATVTDLEGLISYVISLMNLLVPVIIGLAVLGFLFGVMKYIFAHDTKNIADARNYMIFGIIGIAVMLSVWGLAFFVKNTFFQGSPTPGGGEEEGGHGPFYPSEPPTA
jgi:hypothetical protein